LALKLGGNKLMEKIPMQLYSDLLEVVVNLYATMESPTPAKLVPLQKREITKFFETLLSKGIVLSEEEKKEFHLQFAVDLIGSLAH
jgi:hypothetical protein